MGQYYKPCIIISKSGLTRVVTWLSSHKYGSGLKQMEHSYLDDRFVAAFEWLISPEGPHHKSQVVWAGDYGNVEEGYEENLYRLCTNELHATPEGTGFSYPFIVNHTKKEFLNKNEVVGEIHPLPLLTMETAGGGGGDYRGINEHFLGIWARDVISIKKVASEDYQKVSFEFRE